MFKEVYLTAAINYLRYVTAACCWTAQLHKSESLHCHITWLSIMAAKLLDISKQVSHSSFPCVHWPNPRWEQGSLVGTTAYPVKHTLHFFSTPTSNQMPRNGQHVEEWKDWKWPFPRLSRAPFILHFSSLVMILFSEILFRVISLIDGVSCQFNMLIWQKSKN